MRESSLTKASLHDTRIHAYRNNNTNLPFDSFSELGSVSIDVECEGFE